MNHEPKSKIWQRLFTTGKSSNGRLRFIQICFTCFFAILVIRALRVHLFPSQSDNLTELGQRQYQKIVNLDPYRGSIFDRRNNGIAISTKRASVFVNPRMFDPKPHELRKLAELLDIPAKRLKQITNKKNYFSWLKRKIPDDIKNKVIAMNLEGLHTISEPSRYYPHGAKLAQIVGVSGTDNRGLMGLESQYDEILHGHENSISLTRDARGQFIFRDFLKANPETPGNNIFLTVDLAIQEISENALKRGIQAANAKSGAVIVQDPHTGYILAMASYPTFDPNDTSSINATNSRVIGLVNLYEPGSTVKPLVIGHALDTKAIRKNETLDCEENGLYTGNNWRIRDTHPLGKQEPAGIIIHSSNICTYKVAAQMGPKKLFEIYQKAGFGSDNLKVGFPGQATGVVADYSNWRPIRFANISFGQGLLASPLEVIGIYSAIANGGQLMKPVLVQYIKSPDGEVLQETSPEVLTRLFTTETSSFLKSTLHRTVEEGTGTEAKVSAFSVAGKTGTAEKIDPTTHTYSQTLRSASFVGFTPVFDPHLTIYVLIDEPGNRPYYGGTWAAPVFAEVAEKTLKYLNVAPDQGPVATQKLVRYASPDRKGL